MNNKKSLFRLIFSTNSLKQIFKAGKYSYDGFKFLLKERAFVQELLIFFIAIAFALFLANDSIEFILLIASVFLVLLAEAINSAIEAAVDLSTSKIHPLAKKAKDIGSFSVLLAMFFAVFVWVVIIFF